jgi:hypothetical protein
MLQSRERKTEENA